MRRRGWMDVAALLAGLSWWTACGSPVRPAAIPEAPSPEATPTPASTPSPSPSPSPSPTPSPSPSANPGPCADCEEPVSNTNPPVRLNLRLYAVEDPYGKTKFNWDPTRAIPVGWTARLDVVGKDVDGAETNGQGDVQFFVSDAPLVKVSGQHSHQRRLKVLEAGELTCWVTQDGVRSNDLQLLLAK